MKRLLITLAFITGLAACQEEETPIKSTELSASELETLLFTREEEKLAHDVYVYAFQKYGLQLFQNIASSETKHIASVLSLMQTFEVVDPLKGNTTQGEFSNPILKNLYAQLTSRVDQSLEEALRVGLLIEDMDILDLTLGIEESSHDSIKALYSTLKCGSENHMKCP